MATVLDVLRAHLLGEEAAAKLERVLAKFERAQQRTAITTITPKCRDAVTPTNQLLANIQGFAQ